MEDAIKNRAVGAYPSSARGPKGLKPWAALLCAAGLCTPALAQLNDSGQTQCFDTAGAPVGCAAGAYLGQDGRYGRDAQAGAPAFDFGAFDASGNTTAVGGHACVADHVTGLVWLAQTLPAQSWADASAATRGTPCGITGWRLPTRRELLSIVHHGASGPAIDGAYFPSTASAPYWSADAAPGSTAWAVDFGDGATLRDAATQAHAVRLVTRPVNQPPTITLGPDIVVPREDRPGPLTYPAWATGISPGPGREAWQQHLTATVEVLPRQDGDPKQLEFDVPPALDLATGDLSFTIRHRISPPTIGSTEEWWVSSAGLARVRITLRDDGGTANGGQDSTSADFTIFLDPVPAAREHTMKFYWKNDCTPVIPAAFDADTDPEPGPDYVPLVSPYPFPKVEIVEMPTHGLLLSGPDGDTADPYYSMGMQPTTPAQHDYEGLHFNYAYAMCYVPISSTFTGSDAFTYRVIDPDGNVSAPASMHIEIMER